MPGTPDKAAMEALVDRPLATGIETAGVEEYEPNGKKYVVTILDPHKGHFGDIGGCYIAQPHPESVLP